MKEVEKVVTNLNVCEINNKIIIKKTPVRVPVVPVSGSKFENLVLDPNFFYSDPQHCLHLHSIPGTTGSKFTKISNV